MNLTDQIDYARPFAEDVKGKLYARFRLDAERIPMYAVSDGARYYTIDIYLHSPRADTIDGVTYLIDDPTTPESLGESDDRVNDFAAAIECPGDALLRVQVRIGGRVYEQRAWLSQMLENGYPRVATSYFDAVRSAILYVRVH